MIGDSFSKLGYGWRLGLVSYVTFGDSVGQSANCWRLGWSVRLWIETRLVGSSRGSPGSGGDRIGIRWGYEGVRRDQVVIGGRALGTWVFVGER